MNVPENDIAVSPVRAERSDPKPISVQFVAVSCFVGMLAAHSILIYAKWYGLSPPDRSWLDVFVDPALVFGWLASIVILPESFPNQSMLCRIAPTVVLLGIGLALSWFQQGW
jgi:hypothetical protein